MLVHPPSCISVSNLYRPVHSVLPSSSWYGKPCFKGTRYSLDSYDRKLQRKIIDIRKYNVAFRILKPSENLKRIIIFKKKRSNQNLNSKAWRKFIHDPKKNPESPYLDFHHYHHHLLFLILEAQAPRNLSSASLVSLCLI